MTRHQSFAYSAALAAVFVGSTAHADVTAQQVWDNWKGQMGIYGQGFTVEAEEMSGDTLTISGIKIEMSDPEASVTADLGTITLTENGDGTVSIHTPSSYPLTLDFTPEYGNAGTVNMTVSQTGMVLVVSGDPDAMNYDVTADVYAITMLGIEGEANDELAIDDAVIALRDLSARYAVSEDTLTRINYDVSLGALDVDLAVREIGGDDSVAFNVDIADLAMAARIAAPIGMDMTAFEDDVPPFAEGLAIEGGYTFGDTRYGFDVADGRDNVNGEVVVQGGELDVSFDIDGVSYAGETRGISASISAPSEFPFPIDFDVAKYGFDVVIPLSQGDSGPRDARIAFDITDLSISDTIWNLADPQQILSRDPITVAIGLDAKVTPFFDFLDPEQMEAAAMSSVPGEINSAELTGLTVRGAGAEITGTGAFTFDNTDMRTIPGVPRPEGEANFAINGINGLVDNLIQMGIIPEDEAMMPRLMLGMIATPVGDDALTSTIEINGEGHILANGQRLR